MKFRENTTDIEMSEVSDNMIRDINERRKKMVNKIKNEGGPLSRRPLDSYRKKTVMLHGQFATRNWVYDQDVIPPISHTVTYKFPTAKFGSDAFGEYGNPETDRMGSMEPKFVYERLEGANSRMLAERLALAEGGKTAITFVTGMSAVMPALLVAAKAGDQIISHYPLYACSYSLMTNWFPRWNIDVEFKDLRDLKDFKITIRPETKVIFLESPNNPSVGLVDILAVRKIVDAANKKRKDEDKISIVVDNTFATPFCQQPIKLGADIVVHSLTKGLGGFGTDMGGAMIFNEWAAKRFEPMSLLAHKDFGAMLPEPVAWSHLVYGLPTLGIRMKEMQSNALKVSKFLERNSNIEKVNYPGLESFPQYELAKRQMIGPDGKFAPGSMIYFVLKGAPEEAKKRGEIFMDWLAENSLAVTLAVSLGQIRTLIEHPSSMTHSTVPAEIQVKQGIDPGGVRLSIGIEDHRDIIEDIKAGLNFAYSAELPE